MDGLLLPVDIVDWKCVVHVAVAVARLRGVRGVSPACINNEPRWPWQTLYPSLAGEG